MSLFHPNIRLPLWAAILVPAAAYLYRSVSRGFDFRPDLPLDLLVLGLYVVVLTVVIVGRRAQRSQEREEQAAAEDENESG